MLGTRFPGQGAERRDDEHRIERERELGGNALGRRMDEEHESGRDPERDDEPPVSRPPEDEPDEPEGDPEREGEENAA